MNHQIAHKLVALLVAVLVNGVVFASVSYLFGSAAEAVAQQARVEQGAAVNPLTVG